MLGNINPGNWQFKYYLYVTNGRGNDPFKIDDNPNKAIGGRIIISPPIEGLSIGSSYYGDKNGQANNAIQKTLTFDLTFDKKNFYFEGEYFLPIMQKVDTSGDLINSFRTTMGYYGMLAYTIKNRWTPFFRYAILDIDSGNKNDSETDITGGINISISPMVYLKAEVHHHLYEDSNINPYQLFIASVAVAF